MQITNIEFDVKNSKDFLKIYTILDTNILVSHLNEIKKHIENNKSNIITTNQMNNKVLVFFIIPWLVVRELDALKCKNEKSVGVQRKSREAINYLLKESNKKCEYLYFQSSLQVLFLLKPGLLEKYIK
jgi:hypothetical protein